MYPPQPKSRHVAARWLSLASGVAVLCLACCGGLVYDGQTRASQGISSDAPYHPSVVAMVFFGVAAAGVLAGLLAFVLIGRHARPRRPGRPPLNARTLFSPRRTGLLLFSPRRAEGDEDRTIAWLGLARSTCGILVYAVVAAPRTPRSLTIVGTQPLIAGVRTLFLGSVIVGVLVLVAPVFVPSHQRSAAVHAAGGPWKTIVVAWLIAILIELDNRYCLGPLSHRATANVSTNDPSFLAKFTIALGLLLLFLWTGVYLVCFLYYMNRNMFNAADADPRLAPIAASILAVTLVVYDMSPALQRLIPWLHMGEDVPMRSTGLRAGLALCGAGTVTALAALELFRIHSRRAGLRRSAEPH